MSVETAASANLGLEQIRAVQTKTTLLKITLRRLDKLNKRNKQSKYAQHAPRSFRDLQLNTIRY